MKRDEPIAVRFYKSSGATEPVRKFIKDLPEEDRRTVGSDLLVVQWTWPVGKPLVAPLGNGIYELRSTLPNRICRILFFQLEDSLLLLHSFIKKTQKCPKKDLDLALARKKEILDHE